MSHIPEFTGPIEGYVCNFLKRNLWRVRATHDHKDAMQEAYIVFLRVAAKYPMLDAPQHFMALFKTSWAHEFNDLSHRARPANAEISEEMHSDDGVFTRDSIGELDNDGQLAVLINQAPSEVFMVLNLFLSAPQELLDMALASWRASGHYKAEGDRAVSRLLGLPPGSQPMTQTQEYFSH